ncbi:MAG: hypothetical protein WCH46_10460 [bacterium]
MAYLNFLTGIGVVLLLISFIRKKGYEENFWVMCSAFLLLYLCHFVVFSIFALYFFCFYLYEKKYKQLLKLGLQSSPSLILFVQYLLTRTTPIVSPTADSYLAFLFQVHWKAIVLFSPLVPFNVFKWCMEILPVFRVADYVFIGLIGTIEITVVAYALMKRKFSLELILGIATFLIASFLPLQFGGVEPAGERVVLFCVLNLSVVGFRMQMNTILRKLTFCVFLLLTISMYSYDYWNFRVFDSMVGRGEIPQAAIFHSEQKIEGVNGFLHLHFYDDIKSKRPYPYFSIGLFNFADSLKSKASN